MNERTSTVNRRRFLHGVAAGSAAFAFSRAAWSATKEDKGGQPINVALLGAGSRGLVLMEACLKIPGVRFQAVCDIWERYNLKRASRIVQRSGHPGTPYTDHEQMLDAEKGLDAVIVATPDFWHARHTIACLDAGLHVYCEAPMANTVDDARRMVEAARRNGRLLQVGHQRRSNPQYRYCCEKLLKELNLIGRITAVTGQWNRIARLPLGWPRNAEIDAVTLHRYGYESMDQFRNWRRHEGLGAGQVADLGSHQIDVYNWFLGARPGSVLAGGHRDAGGERGHELYEMVAAVYEYESPQGAVGASYQTLTSSRYGGYFEQFMGERGTLVISEQADRTRVYPELMEGGAATWTSCLRTGQLSIPPEWRRVFGKQQVTEEQFAGMFVDESLELPPGSEPLSCALPVAMNKGRHQPHLENFFDAIRGKARLNCPAEVGYEAAVTVLKVNEAIEAGRRLKFSEEEFACT